MLMRSLSMTSLGVVPAKARASGSSTDERCRNKCRRTGPQNSKKSGKCRKCRKIFEGKRRGRRPPCLRFTSENRSPMEVVETFAFFYTPFLHFDPRTAQKWDHECVARIRANHSASSFRIHRIRWAKMRKNAFSILQTSALPLGYRALSLTICHSRDSVSYEFDFSTPSFSTLLLKLSNGEKR